MLANCRGQVRRQLPVSPMLVSYYVIRERYSVFGARGLREGAHEGHQTRASTSCGVLLASLASKGCSNGITAGMNFP